MIVCPVRSGTYTAVVAMVVAAPLLGCLSGGGGLLDDAEGSFPSAEAAPVATEMQYHALEDPRTGMVQALTPYPADWTITQLPNGQTSIEGPGGIRIHPTKSLEFAWSDDPFARQTATQMGKAVAPPAALEQIVEQNLRPAAAQQGDELVRSYPLPEFEAFLRRLDAGMVKTGSHRQFLSLGTDWTDGRTRRSFVSVVRMTVQQGAMTIWILQTTRLEAPEELFAKAKADFLYAVGNTHINPQWLQAANGQVVHDIKSHQQLASEMMEQSRQAHQRRMATIHSQGSPATSVGATYGDILDISHQGYLKRDDIQSGGHQHQVDAIGGRSVIANHETGEHYGVPSGASQYWVRDDAYYLGTDDILFDPNLNPKMNQHQWTRFVVER